MAIKTDSPQVKALLVEVERAFARPIRTPSDFTAVADCIEARTKEHISDSTIKRLWVPHLAYDTVSGRTLDVLAGYAGYGHFEAFCSCLRSRGGQPESELVSGMECVRSSDLQEGDMVEIAWLPDRECTLRYAGGRKYEVVKSANAKIHAGDTFFCDSFVKGRSLYVDGLVHEGEVYDGYGMGLEHGLTRVAAVRSE